MAFSFRRIRRTPRRWVRLGRIAQVLGKHGLGHWLQYMGLTRPLGPREPAAAEIDRGEHWIDHMSLARRLVVALEELGPTFVKLGQLLSTRPDIVPEAYVSELKRLQDRVAPFPGESARRIVERELKCKVEEAFAEFNDEPAASGSIAQVHAAALKSGERVVVKVRRPDIRRTIERDLEVFEWIAGNMERFEGLRVLRPKMIVDEFSRTIRRELDLLAEASYTERFRAASAGESMVRIPKVHWGLTTSEVLTLDRIEGVSITDKEQLAPLGIDARALAERLAGFFLHQFFVSGLFHADPHPGNLLIGADGSVGVVDFGMVGHLSEDLRDHLGTSLIALVQRDVSLIIDVYVEIGYVGEDTDLVGLRRELLDLLDRYYGIPVKLIDLRQAFAEAMRIAREYRIPLPRDFVLLGKSFVTIITYACGMDPDFDIAKVARPYALRLLREKFSPGRLTRRGAAYAWRANNILRQLPGQFRAFNRKLLSGDLRIRMSLEEMQMIAPELDRATNRISLSVILGSVIVGSSLTLHARIPPFVSSVPGLGYLRDVAPQLSLLGLVGFVVAGALGMLVAWGIWKHGKL